MKQASALTHERGHASPQIVTSDQSSESMVSPDTVIESETYLNLAAVPGNALAMSPTGPQPTSCGDRRSQTHKTLHTMTCLASSILKPYQTKTCWMNYFPWALICTYQENFTIIIIAIILNNNFIIYSFYHQAQHSLDFCRKRAR